MALETYPAIAAERFHATMLFMNGKKPRIVIQFAVTEQEKRRWQREAKRWKQSLSFYARKGVNDHYDATRRWEPAK